MKEMQLLLHSTASMSQSFAGEGCDYSPYVVHERSRCGDPWVRVCAAGVGDCGSVTLQW